MASNNPINYFDLPMGSHATAGGPHTISTETPGGLGATQGTGLAAHHGMPSTQTTPKLPLMHAPMQQAPMGQPTIPGIPGIPLGGVQQLTGAAPVDFDVLGPTPVMSTDYTQGYLRSQIGRKVQVDFLIGADNFTDRQGTLVDVGISYIIIRETETDDLMLCDIYSIKFVRFYY